MLVGPPGSGKTETLGVVSRLPNVHAAATMTEASLLSGTPKKQQTEGAKGGLLREIGEYGVILAKDFGSVLSMNRDARAQLLAALREIYDGSWTRHLGTDGGKVLHWEGKVGLVTGCTPAIDGHHAVIGAMGERFALYRLPPTDGEAQALRALANTGNEARMRAEMAEVVCSLFDDIAGWHLPARPLSNAETSRIVDLAGLGVRARSSIERDPYSRDIVLIPEAEAPGRLAGMLVRTLGGLEILGVEPEAAWEVLRKLALDSMPAVRRSALEELIKREAPASTSDVAGALQYPTQTTRRALEELTAFGVLERSNQGAGKADLWCPTGWTWERWPTHSVPEMSDNGAGVPDKSDDEQRSAPSLSTATRNRRLFGNGQAESLTEAAR